jgi:hypothetical protein
MDKTSAVTPPWDDVSMETEYVTIPQGHFGYPDLAFGGYIAGVLGSGFSGGAKVDFFRPTPIGPRLKVVAQNGRVELTQETNRLAAAEPYLVEVCVLSGPRDLRSVNPAFGDR